MANKTVKIVTDPVRLNFVHLIDPTAFEENQTPRYSVTMLVPKNSDLAKQLIAAKEEIFLEEKNKLFEGKAPKVDSAKLWNPIYDGDAYLEEKPTSTEFEGCYYITPRSTERPPVFNKDRTKMEDLKKVYSGCWARVSITMYPYNYKSMGFGFFLNAILFDRDDEPLFVPYDALADFEEDDDFAK